jgi:hypothetical protein
MKKKERQHCYAVGSMNRGFLWFAVWLFSLAASAQTNGARINLWGYVVDSFLQVGLEGTKVTLMTVDSVEVDSIRTYMYDNNAIYYFNLPAKTQDILLKAERDGYETAIMPMKVRHYKRVRDVYVPWINLKKKSTITEVSLDEVVVKSSKVQMVWKGDTLVYNADAFNLPQGSMLDGLIRQLPGVTLKDNGEILVNGRKVDYLTLNGTDFFKGNNKMMLENLPYYTVKNVKVYDKSTEVSQFLGYDAEKKDYVMDVVLKREYSVGLTANAELGGGTKERWMARLFGLRFSDHSRTTVFGNSNNINRTGQPNADGNWNAANAGDGITKHNEVNANLQNEDKYKRWKNEFTVSLTDDDNNRQSRTESEYYLQNGGEFTHRNRNTDTDNTQFAVSNTFTRNKSTSPTYLTSLVGYNYGRYRALQYDSAQVSGDAGLLYRLDNNAQRRSHSNQLYTANHLLAKLPWGDRLNFRLDAVYDAQRMKSFSHYLLKYEDDTQPQDLRRRYEPRTLDSYYWQFEAEYVFRFPHDWNLDINYQFHQGHDADDTPSYRLDRDAAWLMQATRLDALPLLLSDALVDGENSTEISTGTKRQRLYTRLYYLRNTAESYTSFEVKLPVTYERGNQRYLRGEVDTLVRRNETMFDPSITYAHYIYKRNINFNASLRSETTLPNIVNRVGYTSYYDPLNTTIGNPLLKPQHNYKGTAYYVKSWPQWEQTLYTYLEVSVTEGKIQSSVSYDRNTGVYSRLDENINGNWNTLLGLMFNRAIDKMHRWHVENTLWLTYANIVWRGQDLSSEDAAMLRITTRHFKVDDKLKVSYRASQKFDAGVYGGIVHGMSWSNLSSYRDVRITDVSYGLTVNATLPLALQFSSDLSMLHRIGYESSSMNNSSAIWNAQLSKSICRDRLTFRLVAHDILDRTRNNTWDISSTGYTNTWRNTLPRYVMLSVIYKFHREGK